MEPDPLTESEDTRLDALLRAAPAPLPDDGFTARVLAALPPAPARTPLRLVLCIVGAAAGLGVAWYLGRPWTSSAIRIEDLGLHGIGWAADIFDPSALLALTVAAASVAFALLRPGSSADQEAF